MSRRQSWLVALSLFVFGGSIAVAAPLVGNFGEPPRLIPYAGVLEDGGNPVSSSVEMTFFLVGNVADDLGDALWQENQTVVVSSGRFAVALGGETAIPDSVFNRTELYAGVAISDVELAGRQRITTMPYAITAANAENFTVRSTLTVDGAANLNNGLDVDGLAAFNDEIVVDGDASFSRGVDFPGGGRFGNSGDLEVGGDSSPTIDIKNDANEDFDARLALINNDLLRVQGARFHTQDGLRLADGNNLDSVPTLDCQCNSLAAPPSPVATTVTVTLTSGYTRTGGGCLTSDGRQHVLRNYPDPSDDRRWICFSEFDQGATLGPLVNLTAYVCGCRIQ